MEPMQKAINWKRLNISRLDSASTLLLLLLSPQSGKMSLYPKWAGVPARPSGAKIGTGFEILRRPGHQNSTARTGGEGTTGFQGFFADDYRAFTDTFFVVVYVWRYMHNSITAGQFISFPQNLPANFLNGSLPVGPWWRLVVASLYIHTRAPRLEDNAEAAPSIPPTSSSLVYASQ